MKGINPCRNCRYGRLDAIPGDYCSRRHAPLAPPDREDWCEYYKERELTIEQKVDVITFIEQTWLVEATDRLAALIEKAGEGCNNDNVKRMYQ